MLLHVGGTETLALFLCGGCVYLLARPLVFGFWFHVLDGSEVERSKRNIGCFGQAHREADIQKKFQTQGIWLPALQVKKKKSSKQTTRVKTNEGGVVVVCCSELMHFIVLSSCSSS